MTVSVEDAGGALLRPGAPGADSAWFPTGEYVRVRQVPRQPDAGTAAMADAYELTRQATVTAAYASGSGGPLAVLWTRRDTGPTEVHVGGVPGHVVEGTPGLRQLAFPPGAQGEAVPSHQAAQALSGLSYWHTFGLRARPPRDDGDAPPGEGLQRPSLEDALVSAWPEAYGLAVFAVPVQQARLAEETLRAEVGSRAPATRGASAEAEQAMARRRFTELVEAATVGLWDVVVAVGAASPEAATALTGLVASALDLADTDYHATVEDRPAQPWSAAVEAAWGERQSRAALPSSVLVRVARPPLREIPGVRATRQAPFDLTPENEGSVEMGAVVDQWGRDCGPMTVTLDTLNRHTFVCGATGSGKSQTVRHLLETVSRLPRPLPWLVIEPAKAEYARMAKRLEDLGAAGTVLRLRPGAADAVAAGINPLEPCPDPRHPGQSFPLQTHLDLVRALFLAAFEAQEPFPQVLSAALTRCYEQQGWDLVSGKALDGLHAARYPTLADLQRTATSVVDSIGYGQEVASNVRGFVEVRLNSLRLGTPGRFLEGGHPIDIAALLDSRVVVELEDVGDDQDKAFLMGVLLIRVAEHLRLLHGGADTEPPLAHLLVIEEAHRLLRRTDTPGPASHAVELFAGLLAEIRAYGQGVVVVEQIPAKVLPDVVKNTALKIVHRLPAGDDREAVGATMNLTEEQSAYVVSLEPGYAAAFVDGMDSPVLLHTPSGAGREASGGALPDIPTRASAWTACRPECAQGTDRCTVAAMNESRHLPYGEALAVWVESETIRILLGIDPTDLVTPVASVLRDEASARPDRVRCALAQLAEASVGARWTVLASAYDPGMLMRFLTDELFGRLGGAEPAGWDRRQDFLTGKRLAATVRLKYITEKHLDPADWARIGLRPPRDTDQVEAILLAAQHAAGRDDDGCLFGGPGESILERLAGVRRGEPAFRARLAGLLAPVGGAEELVARLTATGSAGSSRPG